MFRSCGNTRSIYQNLSNRVNVPEKTNPEIQSILFRCQFFCILLSKANEKTPLVTFAVSLVFVSSDSGIKIAIKRMKVLI